MFAQKKPLKKSLPKKGKRNHTPSESQTQIIFHKGLQKSHQLYRSSKHQTIVPGFGFTLIELIVVMSILVILSIIAYVAYGNLSSSARDSIRISDLTNIQKGLAVNNIGAGDFPFPDKKVLILSGGSIIGYQGEAGKNILSMIKLSAGGLDPLDNAYYTYSTNLNRNKIQLGAFIEDWNSIAFDPDPIPDEKFKAYAEGYSKDRFLYVRGDMLGITLTTSGGTYIPIQDTGTGIEISESSSGYEVVLSNDSNVIGFSPAVFIGFTGTGNEMPIYGFCSQTTHSGYLISVLSHGETKDFHKPISDGTGTLSVSCTEKSLAFGVEDFSCRTGYVEQGGACVYENCTGITPADGKISNATSTAGGIWNYSTLPGLCTYRCDINYDWNPETQKCDAAAKLFECADEIPENSSWNSVSSYLQTWNGSVFLPVSTATLYNPIESSSACNFRCDAGYHIDEEGKTCVLDTSCAANPSFEHIGDLSYGSPGSVSQPWIYSENPGNCTYTCKDGYEGDGCLETRYPGCDATDIKLSNGQTWSACNVGSNVSGLGSASYGGFYQWGRYDTRWDEYWESAGWNESRGPCAEGYQVPKSTEWTDACKSIGGGICNSAVSQSMKNTLKLPYSGVIYYGDNLAPEEWGYFWASNKSIQDPYFFYTHESTVGLSYINSYYGMPIRCIKSRCENNYSWSTDENKCVADTRTINCTAKPSYTIWNTIGNYVQTWNGTSWVPEIGISSYNTTPSTTDCRYKCTTNFHTENSGASCISNTRACTIGIPNGYGTETWSGSAWGPCTLTSCNAGYAKSGNTCIPKCNTNPSFSNIGTLTAGVPTTPNQAWTYSVTPGNCTYNCKNGFTGTNCTIDVQPPTITMVKPYTVWCNRIGFKVEYSDNGPMNASPISWDGGSIWSSATSMPFLGVTKTLPAGTVKVRDAAGNISSYDAEVSGSTSCSISDEYGPYTYDEAVTKCTSLGAGWIVPGSDDYSALGGGCGSTSYPRGLNCTYPTHFTYPKIYWTSAPFNASVYEGGYVFSPGQGDPTWNYDACLHGYTTCRSTSYSTHGYRGSVGSLYVRCVKHN